MTILGNLPVSPSLLGKLLTKNLILHQHVIDQSRKVKGVLK
ncbi:hypothetical protein [Paracoccus sp. JM45]|nr:hypothetical protein [Paracoccus sp. JM45]